MRNLLLCRRGSAAFATVVALIPLIGMMALGGEAGSWYVIKQHAQNAADAAAYSGALRVACGTPCATDAKAYDYRGKEFAAQHSFCNSGDTNASYPGAQCMVLSTGTTQTVSIAQGTWSANTWTVSASGQFVLATVAQTQPAYLASVLGFNTINIQAQAIAQVQTLANPCVLTLTGQISFQGSPTVNAPNCGLSSNDPASNAINFTGGGGSVSR